MRSMLRPYEAYKKVDLPWLSKIPKHWTLTRNKNHLVFKKDRVGENHGSHVLLSLTKQGIIARDMISLKGKFPKEFDTYQSVNPGDIVFCLFDIDETPRTVGLSSLPGMITGAYTVFAIENINRRYLYYYYLSLDNHKQMKPLYTGLRKVINVDTFLRTKMPYPPREEQDQIVKYLETKLSKINKFIKAKKKQIELLKEQKQAIINQAVTKGLDPDVKMKSSRVEWLEEIPEGWHVCKLKNLGSFKSGINLTSFDIQDTGEYPVYGGNGLRGYYHKSTHTGKHLLIGRQGALCGNVHLVEGSFWATEHAIVVKLNAFVDIIWAKYLIEVMNLNQYSQSAAQPGLSIERIINISTILPLLVEQREIAKYINSETDRIEKAIELINKEINLISEYRTTLISDVVTGKLDVRDINIDDDIEQTEEFDFDVSDEELSMEEEVAVGEEV